MSYKDTTEVKLIQSAQKGDGEAFDLLVRKHASYIYNLSFHLCGGNRADTDDLAQMTFIRAYRAIARFEGRSELKTWLHRICVNLWKNMVRGQKRKKYFQHQSIHASSSGDDNQVAIELEDKRISPLEAAEKGQTSKIIHQAINQLPPDEREVLVLRDIQGYTYEEIAQLCKIPLGTAKSRLSRARRLLRTALEPILRR
ncbi:sigma-70 family RNA polymerase sigma factor [bacterium]|nr:sigma-70 family RNA polymerase sigma factor [bacterium]